jgi:hypothetical protein
MIVKTFTIMLPQRLVTVNEVIEKLFESGLAK